jgi:hypothetical protein
MRFKIILLLFVILFPGFAFSQDAVDSAELERNLGTVEFIDNTSTPQQINTREQIFNIGNNLGNLIRGAAETAGDTSRYFVIHRLHPAEFDKLDGDIFGLGSDAGVDTIRNMRTIIQGYLQGAYSYSVADAALLAEYITIYNAVYRKNRGYFSGRYKTPLLSDLTEGMEGLALRYDEWPGQTLMLIPLRTATDGSLSAVDTSSITDETVINEMRKDDDKGIESRQGMVDLKERESEAAAEKAAAQKAEADTAAKNIAEERQRIENERRQIEAEKDRIANDEATDSIDSTEARERLAQLDEQEDQLDKEDEALDRMEDDAEQLKADAEENEALAAQKEEEADREREAISADQRDILDAAAPRQNIAALTGVFGIKYANKNAVSGTPVQVNPATAEIMKTSSLNFIKARTITVLGGKTIAVAGEKNDSGTHRLIEIDTTTLSLTNQSAAEISPNSPIWLNGNSIYALLVDGGKNYLARFDISLSTLARSRIAVHQNAAIIFQGDRILTQDEQGSVISLKASDLTQ